MSFVGLEGDVYFITDGDAIKIGFSGCAEHRLSGLQSAHPKPLRILHKIPGTMEDEKNFHRQFKHLNIHGEWFRPGPDLMALIEGRDLEAELAFEIADIRFDLIQWAASKNKKVKDLCKSIDSALEAVADGRPFWNPALQIAGMLSRLESELGK